MHLLAFVAAEPFRSTYGRFFKVYAGQVEPFPWAIIVVARNHIAVRHLVAVAVSWLVALLV
jgi:hypothetical protein